MTLQINKCFGKTMSKYCNSTQSIVFMCEFHFVTGSCFSMLFLKGEVTKMPHPKVININFKDESKISEQRSESSSLGISFT